MTQTALHVKLAVNKQKYNKLPKCWSLLVEMATQGKCENTKRQTKGEI